MTLPSPTKKQTEQTIHWLILSEKSQKPIERLLPTGQLRKNICIKWVGKAEAHSGMNFTLDTAIQPGKESLIHNFSL